MYFDTSTLLNQLSAQIRQRFNEIISNSELLSAMQALSAAPSHPYERLKYQLFGEDYKFPTINDLEVPTDFDPVTYNCQLSSCVMQTQQSILSGLSSLDVNSTNINANSFSLPETTVKHNIQFMEIVRNLTVQDINDNPFEIAKKLTSFYVKNYQ
jgi:hypothetical protein